MREAITMADEVLDHGRFVTLKRSIRPMPSALDVRRVDSQDMSLIFTRGKPRPCVLRVSRRMRTAIHPDRSQALADLCVHFYRDESLRDRIPLFPKSVVTRGIVKVRRDITGALM